MQKDVIYIDAEDDITAIIEQVKTATHKIVALVPPKRTGALQSAVNLRLISRAAEGADKRLVLITNNQSLVALAAAAQIPIAKNLQSKPELAEIAALNVDDGEDVIDGAQLPIGEHAAAAGPKANTASSKIDKDLSSLDINQDGSQPAKRATAASAADAKVGKKKVPDFNSFRKKMILIIVGAILLVGFLVWAIFFAPRATVVITARTSPERFNQQVNLGSETNFTGETLRVVTEEVQREVEVNFEATGTEERGERASGSIVFRNCETPTSQNISAGTSISASGVNYTTTASITVPGAEGSFVTGCTAPGVSDPVPIRAIEIGSDYNTGAGTDLSVAGFSDQLIARSNTAISGGSKREVKIVTTGDIQRASEELVSRNEGEVEQQLRGNFSDSITVINDSFVVNRGSAAPSPAVGEESGDGSATLTSTVTYSIRGVENDDLDKYLTAALEEAVDDTDEQRVYSSGFEDAVFSEYAGGENPTATLDATGRIGPNVDDDEVRSRCAGQRLGEIQSRIEAISGVDDVDVNFWPFWVRVVTSDIERISVEFELRDEQGDN